MLPFYPRPPLPSCSESEDEGQLGGTPLGQSFSLDGHQDAAAAEGRHLMLRANPRQSPASFKSPAEPLAARGRGPTGP